MSEKHDDATRQVNPAARRDAPGEEPRLEAEPPRDAQVHPAQGAELDPRDTGGIAE
jgi:hypothetical protein